MSLVVSPIPTDKPAPARDIWFTVSDQGIAVGVYNIFGNLVSEPYVLSPTLERIGEADWDGIPEWQEIGEEVREDREKYEAAVKEVVGIIAKKWGFPNYAPFVTNTYDRYINMNIPAELECDDEYPELDDAITAATSRGMKM